MDYRFMGHTPQIHHFIVVEILFFGNKTSKTLAKFLNLSMHAFIFLLFYPTSLIVAINHFVLKVN